MELEKLSNDELNNLLVNISRYKKSSIEGSGFRGNVFNPDIIIDDLELQSDSVSSSSAAAKNYQEPMKKL